VSVRITQRFESLADTVESDPAGDDRLGVDFTVGKPLQHGLVGSSGRHL
jgi:hypothetical protein